MRNFIFILILFFIQISCSKKEKSEILVESTNELISIPLDEKTSNSSLGFSTSGDFLFNIIWGNNSLQIYDINKRSLIKNLIFDFEGDQGIGQIFGFHVQSLDSIFLFGQVSPIIYLTDTTGIIKKTIRYEAPVGYTSAFVHPHYFFSPPIVIGDEMIVKTHVEGNYREFTNELLSASHMVYAINLTDGNVRFVNHRYPNDYLADGLKHFEPSMAKGKDKIVYSLFGDHRLFYASSFEEELKSTNAESQYLDARLKLFPSGGERLETMQYMNTSSRYDNLVYDPYRNLYYRFAYPTLDITDLNEIQRLRTSPGPFVIMVLDDELNVLGETFFEAGRYMPNNFFIHEDGLYVSINHPDNPENDEDMFKFELLKVIEK